MTFTSLRLITLFRRVSIHSGQGGLTPRSPAMELACRCSWKPQNQCLLNVEETFLQNNLISIIVIMGTNGIFFHVKESCRSVSKALCQEQASLFINAVVVWLPGSAVVEESGDFVFGGRGMLQQWQAMGQKLPLAVGTTWSQQYRLVQFL